MDGLEGGRARNVVVLSGAVSTNEFEYCIGRERESWTLSPTDAELLGQLVIPSGLAPG